MVLYTGYRKATTAQGLHDSCCIWCLWHEEPGSHWDEHTGGMIYYQVHRQKQFSANQLAMSSGSVNKRNIGRMAPMEWTTSPLLVVYISATSMINHGESSPFPSWPRVLIESLLLLARLFSCFPFF